MNDNRLVPAVATHPGELILDELRARKMSQKQLASLMGVASSVLSETINGKRPISLNVATALEKALGISTEYWMNLQIQYNMDVAAIERKDCQSETVSVTIPIGDRNLLRSLARKFGWACVF